MKKTFNLKTQQQSMEKFMNAVAKKPEARLKLEKRSITNTAKSIITFRLSANGRV